ncbi:MAG TPA: PAS domain-containing sensor histidine kinase [Chloroflexota bacterium]|nr:PAS domain-containing sensor histidine kinase [Chloroflexota bacterium]
MQLPFDTGIEPGSWCPSGRQAIIEPSDGAIVGHTLRGIITGWSPAAERFYGYTGAEVVGKPIAMLAPPERREELRAMLVRLRHGESINRLETVRRHKDGRKIDVCVTMSPMTDATGKVRWVSSVTHIMARRRHVVDRLWAEPAEEGTHEARVLAMLAGERRRLARELHDTVVQALYGIVLGARAARGLLDRAPGQAAEPIEYVLSLAEAGLAETRALIFDVRPASLETEGLVAALTKQAAPLSARHGIEVHTDLCDEPALPLDIKEALYRIAQEALHNTVKHAQARRVDMRLADQAGTIVLEVCDDGRGFNPDSSFPGHLGLRSMSERATQLGGTLQIESAPGRGTCVRAEITYAADHAPS